VTFSYAPGAPAVLSEVSAEFYAGAITAIVGPNGAGKSTLLRVLLGLVRPQSGVAAWPEPASVPAQTVADMPAGARARSLVYIPQRLSPAFGFTVRELVEMGRHAAGAGPDSGAIARAMERARVGGLAARSFDELSVGQQQRVGLARALAQLDAIEGPAALLADEPAAAMDPLEATHALTTLLAVARAGRVVVVVLHDLSQVLAFCARTLLLDARGRVSAMGPTGEVLSPRALESLLGLPFDPASVGGRVVTLVARVTLSARDESAASP
jgi:iron complex transport system ATP-binding protein